MESPQLIQPRLTVSRTSVIAGGTLTVTWNGVARPTARDWVGLYEYGAADTHFKERHYTKKSTSGSMLFKIPDGLPVGTYELRLFAKKSFTLLATSDPFLSEKPWRNEIWRVRLSEARGHEMGAKYDLRLGKELPDRPCLIVSADDFNEERDRLTVVPITDYSDEKKKDIPFGLVFERDSEIDFDPDNEETLFRKSGLGIIDYPMIWTVSSQDVFPDCRHGVLKSGSRTEAAVDKALQSLVFDDSSLLPKKSPPWEGHVLTMDLPGRSSRLCLVVSPLAVNTLRKKDFGLIAVVPLVSEKEFKKPDGVAMVDVYHPIGGKTAHKFLALCQEIYGVDWVTRHTKGPFGEVRNHDMDKVREALLDYLDIL